MIYAPVWGCLVLKKQARPKKHEKPIGYFSVVMYILYMVVTIDSYDILLHSCIRCTVMISDRYGSEISLHYDYQFYFTG